MALGFERGSTLNPFCIKQIVQFQWQVMIHITHAFVDMKKYLHMSFGRHLYSD